MPKKIPMRKCVGCGEMKEKKELIRVIKTPEDEILLDITGRANGRGAYVCNNAECFRKAVKNKGLERSLKSRIPDDVTLRIEKELG
ncbi:RNase P modulator RnpM [Butyrivibrio sp. DSM 10294]|uniref:RNase P modulator RnpM n=1 Tax=Butyrivibrio sp. DSM 10294 TaxID=2972457 RepID=UPI00234F7357|nr:YlxR family protein [Butyrivibrio sp. DSM 10294]